MTEKGFATSLWRGHTFIMRNSCESLIPSCTRGGQRGLTLFLFFLAFGLRADQVIYDDALENSWQNWGWATLNYANTSPVHTGSDSISVTMSGWQGLQIYHADMDSTPYSSLTFWLNGGTSGGQRLQMYGLVHSGTTNNFGQTPATSYPL